MDVSVFADRVVARFERPFLGLQELSVSYKAASRHFRGRLEQSAKVRGADLNLELEINGKFSDHPTTPEVEYEFSFDKRGNQPGWECQILGKGSGMRTGEPPE